jgi:uncharacterized protein DUF6928
MGWKLELVVARCERYQSAEEVAKALKVPPEICSELTFDRAIYPAKELSIALYQDCVLLTGVKMVEAIVFEEQTTDWDRRLMKVFPREEVLVASLHSVTNTYGYALYREGAKCRVHAGSTDTGLVLNYGDPWPAELKIFEKGQRGPDGQWTFVEEIDGVSEEIGIDRYGEEFVFELCAHFLGQRLDMADDSLFELPMKQFAWSGREGSWWKRLFSRARG